MKSIIKQGNNLAINKKGSIRTRHFLRYFVKIHSDNVKNCKYLWL